MSGHRFVKDLLCQLEDALMTGSRSDDESDSKVFRARKGLGLRSEHLDSRNGSQLLLNNRDIILGRSFADTPGLQHHSSETEAGLRDLKREPRVRKFLKDFISCFGVTDSVINRRI